MKLYVGNLPYAVSESDLNDMFVEYGNVLSAKIITDRETGRSKGFGFVEFGDKAAGEQAIEALNGKEMKGRALVVNEARPQKPRQDRRW